MALKMWTGGKLPMALSLRPPRTANVEAPDSVSAGTQKVMSKAQTVTKIALPGAVSVLFTRKRVTTDKLVRRR